jgi:hypothetical protein
VQHKAKTIHVSLPSTCRILRLINEESLSLKVPAFYWIPCKCEIFFMIKHTKIPRDTASEPKQPVVEIVYSGSATNDFDNTLISVKFYCYTHNLSRCSQN